MILREVSPSRFSVLGHCYIHGLQGGEGILGPLPPHWKVIFMMDTLGRLGPKFLNTSTNDKTIPDPRLGPLARAVGRTQSGTHTRRPRYIRKNSATSKTGESDGLRSSNDYRAPFESASSCTAQGIQIGMKPLRERCTGCSNHIITPQVAHRASNKIHPYAVLATNLPLVRRAKRSTG